MKQSLGTNRNLIVLKYSVLIYQLQREEHGVTVEKLRKPSDQG